ncbi:unnamed protein product [Moneuplotes crassus]|uniref:Peptidase A1 domain-containing protein n=1 Tax=Euplotes crassus TaxID=5936 RepID=A0AAD1UG49_EUPCR|nr:unnamed protein product [Moneuplotes crassus]
MSCTIRILILACIFAVGFTIKTKRGSRIGHNLRNRGRNLSSLTEIKEKVYSAPIYGNISEIMYYYVDVYVGNPSNPSKQALIVDTGSSITCFPCIETCEKCGDHIFSPLSLYKSASAYVENCKDYDCGCGDANQCLFEVSYNEGSSYEGFFVTDYFQFSSNPYTSVAPKYTFGCVTRETNLFLSQISNGIMGLQPVVRDNFKPVFYTFYENGFIEKLQFSLLLEKNGGMMYLGGYDNSVLAEPPQNIVWIDNISDENYRVSFDNLSIDDEIISGGIIAKIDSGITFTYITQKQYDNIETAISNFCKQKKYKCLGRRDDQGCYRFIPFQEFTYKDFFYSFPVISFHVGSKKINWYPSDYFYQEGDAKFCLAIEPYAENESNIVLGASFLQNYLVIFDVEHQKVGFVRAATKECDRATIPKMKCSNDPHQTPVIKSEYDISEYNRDHKAKSFSHDLKSPISFKDISK